MVQTPEGHLWFGVCNGLVRFDGVKLTVFNLANTPGLPRAAVVNSSHFPQPHSDTIPRDAPGLHILGFAIVTASTVYVIMDLEHPRFGLIRVSAADQELIELRASMK